MIDKSTFFDGLSQDEGEFCEKVIQELDGKQWATPLLRVIRNAGGIRQENKALLFELRFAAALDACGIDPDYEIPGAHGSTIDFGFSYNGVDWSVELMRLEETEAVQAATLLKTGNEGGEVVVRNLSSTAADPRQSEEGETLKAVQRICQKCEKDGHPYKFELPNNSFNVLLVDFRTFLNGGDAADRVHVALGGKYLANDFLRRGFNGRLITGVFDESTTLKGAPEARERVHFIGFVNERKFGDGGFGDSTQFIANPQLFSTNSDMKAEIDNWPLQPVKVLNAGA